MCVRVVDAHWKQRRKTLVMEMFVRTVIVYLMNQVNVRIAVMILALILIKKYIFLMIGFERALLFVLQVDVF